MCYRLTRLTYLLKVCLVVFSVATGCTCQDKSAVAASELAASADSFHLDIEKTNNDLDFFTSAPHPFGSARQKDLAQFLLSRLQGEGLSGEVQNFSSETPNPDYHSDQPRAMTQTLNGSNVIATIPGEDQDCTIILASHYDTKIVAQLDYLGANDGGSSSVLLLHLMSYLKKKIDQKKMRLTCSVTGVWFDGEEAVLAGWNDGTDLHPSKIEDHTYGSRYFVSQLQGCPQTIIDDYDLNKPQRNAKRCLLSKTNKPAALMALILLDMVGSQEFSITPDRNSHGALRRLLADAAQRYGLPLSSREQAIGDDHEAFIKQGIASIDIIDFNHLETWHTALDTSANVSRKTMENVGKMTLFLLSQIERRPKDFLP